MMITHKLEMDLQQRGRVQRIEVVQGDRNTRQLEVTLLSGGSPWKVPSDVRVNLRYCKADGTGGWYSQWPEEVDCWSFGENVLTVLLAPPLMAAEGLVFVQIELEQGEDLLATFGVQVYVEPNVASRVLESDNYVDRPQWMKKQLNQWLETVKNSKLFDFPRYEDTPFRVYDLPLEEYQDRYIYSEDKKVTVLDNIGRFSPVVKCPRYLGWKLEEGSQIYLYIGDMVKGKFRLDEAYIFHTHKTSDGRNLVNYLQSQQNRFVEVEEGKYFCYRISEDQGVTILGCDSFPKGDAEAIGVVPDCVSAAGTHMKNGENYAVVLPGGCRYGVLVRDSDQYSLENFNVSVIRGTDTERISNGVSFGTTGEDGVTLLTVPGSCRLEDLTIYLSKSVKTNPAAGRGQKARELGRKLIREFSFVSKKNILWNDSALPLLEGKRFYGVPYSSRWVNAHFVGFEVSVETALNALNDPCSIAYDGGLEVIRENNTSRLERWSVSGHSEVPVNQLKPQHGGGTGYGLVCSAFASLIFGNPYPQTNRGFTFDSNYIMGTLAAPVSGALAVNKGLTHCVMVDELYEDGYSIMEATDPCVAKTVHTSGTEVSGALNGKTGKNFLNSYLYTVVNLDDSGYDNPLLIFDDIEIPAGVVRPWRGHKAVYGPWEKDRTTGEYKGTGIGVTLHPTQEQLAEGTLRVKVEFIPQNGGESARREVLDTSVPATERYLDIGQRVTESGTYFVSCGDGKEEMFRYYDHAPVVLCFDGNGRALFRYENGLAAEDVLYAYIRVTGYGGNWGRDLPAETGGKPMVVAAGKCYPELAADRSRITAVYGAIVKDPAAECWGKYSCLCSMEESTGAVMEGEAE